MLETATNIALRPPDLEALLSGVDVDLLIIDDVEGDTSAACAFTGVSRTFDGTPFAEGEARTSRGAGMIKKPCSSYFFSASFGRLMGLPCAS